MLHSLQNWFSSSWANLVTALGTTTLSIFLFSFVVPILIFIARLVINWRQGRKTGVTMKKIVTRSLRSWQTFIPTGIYLLAWFGLLGWSLSTTAYRDHQALLARIRQLRTDNKKIRQDSSTAIAKLQAELDVRPKVVVRSNNVPVPATIVLDQKEKGKRLEIRTKLGSFLHWDSTLQQMCLADPPPPKFSCVDQANDWLNQIRSYIVKELESSYLARFDAAKGLSLSYNGAKTPEIDNVVNFLAWKATILEEFIREFRD